MEALPQQIAPRQTLEVRGGLGGARISSGAEVIGGGRERSSYPAGEASFASVLGARTQATEDGGHSIRRGEAQEATPERQNPGGSGQVQADAEHHSSSAPPQNEASGSAPAASAQGETPSGGGESSLATAANEQAQAQPTAEGIGSGSDSDGTVADTSGITKDGEAVSASKEAFDQLIGAATGTAQASSAGSDGTATGATAGSGTREVPQDSLGVGSSVSAGKEPLDQLASAATPPAELSSSGQNAGTAGAATEGITGEKPSDVPGSGSAPGAQDAAARASATEKAVPGKSATPTEGDQSRAGAGGVESGRSGAASAATTQAAPPGRVTESISSGRVTTAGGEPGGANTASNSANGEQRFALESGEGNGTTTAKGGHEGEASEFSVRGAQRSTAGQEQPALGASASRTAEAAGSSGRNEGPAPGSSTSLNGSGNGSASTAESAVTARGSQPSGQPTSDAARLAGSSTTRLEQALNADAERGFVGRLRDNGEMRLTVHRNDLGDIELRVAVRDSSVHASMATQHDEARQLLNSQRADLETALQRYNLRLDSFSVEVGGRGDGRSSPHRNSEHGWASESAVSTGRGSGSGEASTTSWPQPHDNSGSGLSVRV